MSRALDEAANITSPSPHGVAAPSRCCAALTMSQLCQIAKEPAAAGCSAFRDFVRCRFADAACGCGPPRPPSANLYNNYRRSPLGGTAALTLKADVLYDIVCECRSGDRRATTLPCHHTVTPENRFRNIEAYGSFACESFDVTPNDNVVNRPRLPRAGSQARAIVVPPPTIRIGRRREHGRCARRRRGRERRSQGPLVDAGALGYVIAAPP